MVWLAACASEPNGKPIESVSAASAVATDDTGAWIEPDSADHPNKPADNLNRGVAGMVTLGHGSSRTSVLDSADPRPDEPAASRAALSAPPGQPSRPAHLSNDDSLNVASAQRAILSAQAGKSVDRAHLRPYELLNYVHATTAPVAPDALFSLRGAARWTEDDRLTLALSLAGARVERGPVALTLVVDRSGSMETRDGRLRYVRRALRALIGSLDADDQVDLVFFDHNVQVVASGVHTTVQHKAELLRQVASFRPYGGTDIAEALDVAYQLTRKPAPAGAERRVFLFSDANATAGQQDPALLSQVAAAWEERGVRLTAVGVGDDVNDVLLDDLSEKGRGAYLFVGSDSVVERYFGEELPSVLTTIADDLRVSLTLPAGLELQRFYGEESSTVAEEVDPVEFTSGAHQLLLQDLQVSGPVDPFAPLRVNLDWRDVQTGAARSFHWESTLSALLAEAEPIVEKARASAAWTDVVMTSRRDPACASILATYQTRARMVPSDAEVWFLSRLVDGWCLPVRRVSTGTNTKTNTKTSAKTRSKPRPSGSPTLGPVTLRFVGSPMPTYVDVHCANRYRARRHVTEGEVMFSDVEGTNCRAFLRGVTLADFSLASGTHDCYISGGEIECLRAIDWELP